MKIFAPGMSRAKSGLLPRHGTVAPGSGRMAAFSTPMKISLSFFVLFMLLGLATSLALYHQQFAFDRLQAAVYYRGNADDEAATTFFVEKSWRQMLETAHFHLYIMPVVYLAFVHLYFLSLRSNREKCFMAVIIFSSLLLEIATPWLVRYLSPASAILFWISGIGLAVSTLWMSLVCLLEMWFKGSAE